VRPGVRLGIDVGRARVGVASCDRDGLLATPVATLTRGPGTVAEIAATAGEYSPVEIVVGLPISLSGADTPSTADARALAAEIAAALPVPVRLVDERMTTNVAQRNLRAAGRSSRRQRSVVDQVAAVIILQNALDAERASGRPPGVPVATEGSA
jgi:putative holliday junction resolvase